MKFFKDQTKIDFMSRGRLAMILSAVFILISIVSLSTRGLNFGLDFTGGTLIEVSYPSAPQVSDVRENLSASGFPDAVVQTFGTATDIVVRIPPRPEGGSNADLSTEVLQALQQGVEGEIDMRRVRRGRLILGIADGRVFADGEKIYTAKDMRVGLVDKSGN